MRWILVGIIALCNTVGDVLNTAGMKRQGEAELNPRAVAHMMARIFRNPLARSIGRGLHRAAVSAFDLECKFRCTCHRDQLFARNAAGQVRAEGKSYVAALGRGIASGFRRPDAVVVAAESQPLTL